MKNFIQLPCLLPDGESETGSSVREVYIDPEDIEYFKQAYNKNHTQIDTHYSEFLCPLDHITVSGLIGSELSRIRNE